MTTLLSFTSCSKDDAQAVIPHISGMAITPNPATAGEKCTMTVTFDRKGENIQGHYKYTISNSSSTLSVGEFKATPTASVQVSVSAPSEAGSYTVKVECTKVDTYVGGLYYMGKMSDIGSATTTLTVTEAE